MIQKYRAWHKQKKKWIDIHAILLDDTGKVWKIQEGYQKGDIKFYYPYEFDLEVSVEKDKNGKDIFEGDIIKHPMNGIGDVFLSADRDTWEISYCEEIGDIDLYLDAKECEKIGNIHENPEFLHKNPIFSKEKK